jgi:mono/diheme cytochrome c family protein
MNEEVTMRPIQLAVVAVLGGLASACAQPDPQAESRERGFQITQRHCNSCHEVQRQGDPETANVQPGPPFRTLAGIDEPYFRGFLTRRHPFMPQYTNLSRQDGTDLLAYIRSLR